MVLSELCEVSQWFKKDFPVSLRWKEGDPAPYLLFLCFYVTKQSFSLVSFITWLLRISG